MARSPQYVSSLLPMVGNTDNWLLFDLHSDTDGIFEHIAECAAERGFRRDEQYRNVFHGPAGAYVGYWTLVEHIEREIDSRNRGFSGGVDAADELDRALRSLAVAS